MKIKKELLIPFLLILSFIGIENLIPNNVSYENNNLLASITTPNTVTNIQVSMAADIDDDQWNYNTLDGTWTHIIGQAENYLTWYGESCNVLQYRFQLPIVQYATIVRATLALYEFSDNGWGRATIKRINESNVGNLEGDIVAPEIVNDNFQLYQFDDNANEWGTADVQDMVQDQVNLEGWVSDNYIGFRLNLTQMDLGVNTHTFRDYQYGGSSAYLDISYISNTGWLNGRQYRKGYYLSEDNNPGGNFSLPLIVSLDGGTSLDNVFYLNNLSKTDFSDVQFTDSDGETLLSYELGTIYPKEEVNFYTNASVDFASYAANYPSAYYFNQRTYIVFQGDLNPGTIRLDPHIVYYDHENDTWSGIYYIDQNVCTLKEVQDNHGSPCLWIDNLGYIHVVYGAHDSPILHSRSVNPEDISEWISEIEITTTKGTYPTIYYDSIVDKVHVLYRRQVSGVSDNVVYRSSLNNGVSWSDEDVIFDLPNREYFYMGGGEIDSTNSEIVHLGWHYFHSGLGENIYYAYLNTTSGILYDVQGNSLGSSITVAEAESNCMVYDSSNNEVFIPNVRVDSNSIPYIFFAEESGNNPIYFTYWNGVDWESEVQVSSASSAGSGYDFIIHSSKNITAFCLDGNDMSRFTWDGNIWTHENVIGVATGSQFLSFSMIPINYVNDLQVIFTDYEWQAYEHKEAWAWGEKGIVKREIATRAEFSILIEDALPSEELLIYIYYGIATSGYSTNPDISAPPESSSNPVIFSDSVGSSNQTSIQTEVVYVKGNDSDFLWLSTIALNNVVFFGFQVVKKRRKKNPNLTELFQKDE